jgi:hypothetical protein
MHVVAVQAEHDVVAGAAVENVRAIERLIGGGARLNEDVRGHVIIASDDELRALVGLGRRRVRRICLANCDGGQCDRKADSAEKPKREADCDRFIA